MNVSRPRNAGKDNDAKQGQPMSYAEAWVHVRDVARRYEKTLTPVERAVIRAQSRAKSKATPTSLR